MMKNIFVVIILFFLAITGLGFSAPQKTPTISDITPDGISKFAKLVQDQDPISLLTELSPQCQATLLGIVTSLEFLTCIPIPSLLPLLPIVTDPDEIKRLVTDPQDELKKIQPVLISVSDGICGVPKCSDAGVASAIQEIQSGCQTDITNPIIEVILAVAVFYSPARDSICFKDAGSPSQYCIAQDDVTTFINLPKSPFHITDGGFIDSLDVASPTVICTPCNKAIYNTFANYVSKSTLAQQLLGRIQYLAEVWVAIKCGLGFEDGTVSDPSKPPKK